ncbi:MAG: hypothetical protein MZV49_08150 [Rhodopseudomonas palustris]|nr:hypothetical protein [Rhodopseudomonas palustris]
MVLDQPQRAAIADIGARQHHLVGARIADLDQRRGADLVGERRLPQVELNTIGQLAGVVAGSNDRGNAMAILLEQRLGADMVGQRAILLLHPFANLPGGFSVITNGPG